jgi:hypothetical protein
MSNVVNFDSRRMAIVAQRFFGVTVRGLLVSSAHAADKLGVTDPTPAVLAGRLLRKGTTEDALRVARLIVSYLEEVLEQEHR